MVFSFILSKKQEVIWDKFTRKCKRLGTFKKDVVWQLVEEWVKKKDMKNETGC